MLGSHLSKASSLTQRASARSLPASPGFGQFRDYRILESLLDSPHSENGHQADTEMEQDEEAASDNDPMVTPKRATNRPPNQLPPAPQTRSRSHNVNSSFQTAWRPAPARSLFSGPDFAPMSFPTPAPAAQAQVDQDREPRIIVHAPSHAIVPGSEALAPALDIVSGSLAEMTIEPMSNDIEIDDIESTQVNDDISIDDVVDREIISYDIEIDNGNDSSVSTTAVVDPDEDHTMHTDDDSAFVTPPLSMNTSQDESAMLTDPVVEFRAHVPPRGATKRRAPINFAHGRYDIGQDQEVQMTDLSASHIGIDDELVPRSNMIPSQSHAGSSGTGGLNAARSVRPKLGRSGRYIGLGAGFFEDVNDLKLDGDEPTQQSALH